LIAGALALSVAAQSDTVLNLGVIQRDLTGDGVLEILRLTATGVSVDSLSVTFVIESDADTLFQTTLAPLTRSNGYGTGRRELSVSERRGRIDSFAEWFFGDTKFASPEEFVEELRSTARLRVAEIPDVIARDRRRQFVIDSLMAAGQPHGQAERRARRLAGTARDTAGAAAIWNEIQTAGVTVFTYSPGGDGVYAIAWSARDQRFYRLLECC
jgi:hypothetical protein